jgi:hypothetical protein
MKTSELTFHQREKQSSIWDQEQDSMCFKQHGKSDQVASLWVSI